MCTYSNMPASKGSANNVLGKDFTATDSVFQRDSSYVQAMNSEGNNQSDVDDLFIEECSSNGKESGISEERYQLVNQVSGHVGLQKRCCLSQDTSLKGKSEEVVKPDIRGGGDFSHKTAKNV